MDPKETLKELRAAIEVGNYGYAVECLSNYAVWRIKGGFEPVTGDAEFQRLAVKLAEEIEGAQDAEDSNYAGREDCYNRARRGKRVSRTEQGDAGIMG